MDESGKQPASQVDSSDPAILPPLTNPIKKGKRSPKEVVETEVSGSKKQKIVNGDVDQDVERKNFETETREEQPSSSKEHCSEEQNEVEVPPAIKSATTSQDGKRGSSVNESEEDGDDNSKKEADKHLETPKKCVEVPPTKKSAATTQGAMRASSSNESDEKDEDDNSNVDDQPLETPMKSGCIDTDVEMFDASSVKKTPQTSIVSQATGSKTLLMSNLSFLIKEGDVINFFKNVGEIAEVHFDMKEDYFTGQAHVEFTTAESAQEALRLNSELLLDQPVRLELARERGGNSTTTPATGSKSLYLGNLSFSIEEDDVRDFFKDVGEIADIRFAIRDDKFLGYGHVDFTTAEAAQEALKLNNKVILDRRVKLNLTRERGAYTPGCSTEKSNQKGAQPHGKTIFVRGFDSSDGFENIRVTLEKHFGKCGEISRMFIPKDYESGAPKGIAFIDFVDSNGVSQALELDGSEVGGSMITVQEAKNQRADSEGSGHGGHGGGGGNGSGGGWSGRSGSGGGWGGGNNSGGGWGGRSSFGGGQSGSGGHWGGENGSGGGRAIGSGWGSGSSYGGGRSSGSGYGGGRSSGSGYGGGRSSGSGYGGGWSSGSGYGSGLARESGSAGGWGIESGYHVSGRGGERGSGGRWASGNGGGWVSGSGYGGSGRSREGESRSGWSRGSGSAGGWGRGSGSAGGWGGRFGRGFSGSRR